MKKIILSGYMGCGKSTIARLMHQKTGMKMIDLDGFIEQKAHKSIPEIFASEGEIQFRKREHTALKEVLDSRENFILSLGGGTPCYANNHELLKGEDKLTVYLRASPETLFERLMGEVELRPLLQGKSPSAMKEFIAQHLFERSYFYNQADYKIATDGKTPEQIVTEIGNLLA